MHSIGDAYRLQRPPQKCAIESSTPLRHSLSIVPLSRFLTQMARTHFASIMQVAL